MDITRRSNNTTANTNIRSNNLSTWGPLISRLAKMGVEYAQSNARKNTGGDSVGNGTFSTQYSRAGTKRRGQQQPRRQKLGVEGIPRVLNVKVQYLTLKGSHMMASELGSTSRKYHLGDSTAVDDLLITQPTTTLALIRAYTCFKYQKVVCTFTPCTALTEGGYHSGVARSNVDTITTVTPYEIQQRGGVAHSSRIPLVLTLIPTHHDGVVHYNEGTSSNELEESKTGTILYYIAAGSITSTAPICILTYTVNLALWHN